MTTKTLEDQHDNAVQSTAHDVTETTTDHVGKHTWRFWCVFLALCFTSFVCSMDVTIVVAALPTITREIGGEEKYIWIANSFIFSSTAPQPLFAQISNIFGRRNPFIFAIVLFALGVELPGVL